MRWLFAERKNASGASLVEHPFPRLGGERRVGHCHGEELLMTTMEKHSSSRYIIGVEFYTMGKAVEGLGKVRTF